MKNSMEDMLEGLQNVRVELLDDNTKLLFDTIMREFDKRDNYKQALEKIKTTLSEVREMKPITESVDVKPKAYLNYCLYVIDSVLGDSNDKFD